MKIARILLILALVFVALGASQTGVRAGAFTYTSGFQVQNLESTPASVTITFYNQDGSINATIPNDPIGANGSKTYFPLTAVSENFNGSVVITSDKQVASVSNILGNGGAAAASYVAATTGNTTVLLPLLMKGNSGFNTWFNVQNTGTADANVTVNYSDGTQASKVIKPGAAQTFDQALEAHTPKVFSAVITSDQPVAATVVEESTKVMFAYSGVGAGSTNPVMPLINANNSGYQTGVQIQNAGNADTSVTVSYTPASAGAACTETQSVPAGQSVTFALAAFANGANSTCAGGAKFIGSAQVSANSASQPLVAIVNQLKGSINGEAYGAFNPADATANVVMPLILDRRGGYFTGFNVMNVGTGNTSVSCTFTGSAYTVTGTLAPGQALNDLQSNKIATNYAGSGTCTAPGGKIVAVVNELGPSSTADQLLVYEGVTVP